MKIFLLRSLSNRFPNWPERNLKDISSFTSLEELLGPDISDASVLLIAEVIQSADAARVMLWRDWHRELLLANAAKILLLVATKDESVFRQLASHGVEILHFPFQERSLVFKVTLQERLLKSTRSQQVINNPKIPNGPDPKQGNWTVNGSTPNGKTRWRWITTKADLKMPETTLELKWQAESRAEPVYRDSAWQLEGNAKIECVCENDVVFSLESHLGAEATPSAEALTLSGERSTVEKATSLQDQFLREDIIRKSFQDQESFNNLPDISIEEMASLTTNEILKSETAAQVERPLFPKSISNIDELLKVRPGASNPGNKNSSPNESPLSSQLALKEKAQQEKKAEQAAPQSKVVDPKFVGEALAKHAEPERNSPIDEAAKSAMEQEAQRPKLKLVREALVADENEMPSPAPVELGDEFKEKSKLNGELEASKAQGSGRKKIDSAELIAEKKLEERDPKVAEEANHNAHSLEEALSKGSQGLDKSKPENKNALKKSILESDIAYQANAASRKKSEKFETTLENIKPQEKRKEENENEKIAKLIPKEVDARVSHTDFSGPLGSSSFSAEQVLQLNQTKVDRGSSTIRNDLSNIQDMSTYSRNFILKSLTELQDRNSSWERAEKFRLYLSASDKYEGIREPADVLPLWIYQGELAPQYIEESKSWKFYDRGPVLCLELNHVPVAVMVFLKELIRPRARTRKEKRKAWAKEKDFKKFYHASGEFEAADAEEPIPPVKKTRSFFQEILKLMGLGS